MSLLLAVARACAGLLLADWRNLVLAVLVAIGVVHFGWTDPALRRARADAIAARDKERAAHQATIANYGAAALAAERTRQATNTRVSAEQAGITERVENDYQARLASLRGRADRLAQQLRSASTGEYSGAPGDAHLSDAGQATGGAVAAPACPRLPAASSGSASSGALNLRERVIASEQALQLDTLIDWVEAQAAVRTNP